MATLDSCGSPDHQLIRFIPEEELTPGVAAWKPSLCMLCPAGCGLLVRVMDGDAEVIRNGKQGLIQMGLAKKLEGNPRHPVNRGKLCARGQAGLQALYHPDRLRNPLKRSGARGSGEFQEVSWEEATRELTAHLSALLSAPLPALRSSGDAASLAFLTRPLRGQRRALVEGFLKTFGAPPPVVYEAFEEAVLRRANLLSFGRAALPTIDLARADYLISFGADFLGTWNSPIAQSIGYGEMRQGRAGRRGTFVQVEPHMSQTGANADEWIPCRPGTEGLLALGIAHVILQEKLRAGDAGSRAGSLISGWKEGLPDYSPESVEKRTGVAAATVARLAHELAARERGAAIIGGAPLAHTNGMFNALAVNALEAFVDTSQPGEAVVTFTAEGPLQDSAFAGEQTGTGESFNAWAQAILSGQAHAPKALMINDANPVFSAPAEWRAKEAIGKIPYVVSFGSFLDETSSLADLVLPDHAALESWLDDVPESGAMMPVVSLAAPAVRPLHDTKATPDILLDVAQRLGGSMAAALPWKSFDAMLQAAFAPLRTHSNIGGPKSEDEDDFWSRVQEQGGWWGAGPEKATTVAAAISRPPATWTEPTFDGAADEFPFHFLPYASQSFGDGSQAHLPWLQELPDVLTTAMWSSWVEVNPQTAERLKIAQGDLVEVASQHGSLRAPAILSPGIAPDVVAMPVGQGHERYGRYASGRGANAYSILTAVTEPETGALAWAATRVKIARVGGVAESKLILYAGGMSRFPEEPQPR